MSVTEIQLAGLQARQIFGSSSAASAGAPYHQSSCRGVRVFGDREAAVLADSEVGPGQGVVVDPAEQGVPVVGRRW